MEDNKTTQQSERSRYRSSLGATLLFSSVQFYQILIRIIKSKFVALFIGPAGMGIQSLLFSTVDTISAATNMGLNTSSVKTIATAYRDQDKILISKTVTAQRRLIWITGIIGMLICAILAPVWSQTSFGNSDYTTAFLLVSSIVLLDQLNKGELALLQGMQQKKQLARANVIGQTLNAIITIPLYYIYGIKAIVAALVLGSLITLSLSLFYSHRLGVMKVKMSWMETFSIGGEMLKLGFVLSLQYLMSTLVVWIIRNYISGTGGVDEVGLYTAGTAIVSTYIGLVFSAVATDYFPRLVAAKTDKEMVLSVRTQAEITILLLAPLIVAFLVFIKPVIILLYSERFLPIENMMYWSIGAVLIQAMGWAASYTLLAKAKPTVFFLNELAATVWGLPIKLLCYKYFGLSGFGMATLVVFVLYLVQVLLVTNKLFGIKYESSLWRLFILLNIPVLIAVSAKLLLNETMGYIAGSFVLIITGGFALFRMNKKMDIFNALKNRIKK